MRERAREEIGRILESASFDVEPMDPPLDLSAIREDECVLVLCSDDEAECAEFDTTVYRVRYGDRDVVCRKILFSTSDRAAVADCVLWGIPALMDYAGKAACARVLDREMLLDLAPPRGPQLLGEPARPAASGGRGPAARPGHGARGPAARELRGDGPAPPDPVLGTRATPPRAGRPTGTR